MSLKQKATAAKTQRGKLIWIGLTLFVALWMFVLGLLIGRGTAPVNVEAFELNKELERLKQLMTEQEQAKLADAQEGASDDKNDLVFYDDLKQDRTQIPPPLETAPVESPRTGSVTKTTGQNSSPSADQSVGNSATVAHKAARTIKNVATKERAAPPDSPTVTASAKGAPEQPKRPDNPVPASTAIVEAKISNGRYTVQVAAVKDAPSAEKMVARLRGKDFPAYHIHRTANGQDEWYRVRVGAFKNRAAAEAMLQKLLQAKFKGIVVATP